MGNVVGRLALEVGDHKRRLCLEETVIPALLQVPVVQAGQEDFICGIGDDTVGLVLSLSNHGQLTVDVAGVGRGQCINSKHNLEYKVVTLLAEVKVVLSGILHLGKRGKC